MKFPVPPPGKELQNQKASFAALLRHCTALTKGNHVQQQIRQSKLEGDTLLGNLLVEMYGKLGSLQQAEEAFSMIKLRNVFSWTIFLAAFAQNGHLDHAAVILEKMPQRNSVSWNSVISSCARWGDCKRALFFYRRMDQAGERPSEMTLLAVAEACSSGGAKMLEQGMSAQHRIVESGFMADNQMVGNSLVSMYGKCGSIEHATYVFENLLLERDMVSWNSMLGACALNGCLNDAEDFFDKMPGRSIVSWNSMMTAFARNRRAKDAVLLFQEMEAMADVAPNEASFVIVLDACATHSLLPQGRQIHESARRRDLESDTVVGTLLVNMYGKCGSLLEAEAVFALLREPCLVSWNAMISACKVVVQYECFGTRRGYNTLRALKLLRKMDLEGCQADEITILSVADACHDFATAKLVFSSIEARHLFAGSVFVNTTFINAFARCGALKEAKKVFDMMQERSVVSWNSMLSALVQHGASSRALELFQEMDLDGVQVTAVTIVTILEIFPDDQQQSLRRLGEEIHAAVMSTDLELDPLVSSALISMHGKSRDLEAATKVYNQIKNHPGSMASRTAMLTALSQNGYLEQARQIFLEAIPFERSTSAWNAMISAYAQNNEDESAVATFLAMVVEGVTPDNVTFTSLLGSCSALPLDLVKLLHATMEDGDPAFELDDFATSALVKSYGKCGDFESASTVFHDRLSAEDPASWNVVMAAFSQNGAPGESIGYLRRMLLAGVRPNLITFATALDACSSLAQATLASLLHSMIVESRLESSELVSNALVNLYGKCGISRSALDVFRAIPRQQQTVVSWTSIITAVSESGGDPAQALEFFRAMNLEGVAPDQVTFVSILSALGHAGGFEACHGCFWSMQAEFGVEPIAEHYACIVNLLGRAGELRRAEELTGSMPYEPGYLIWMTLLGASGIHSCSSFGARAASNVLMVDVTQAAAVPYVLLSNLYAAEMAGLQSV
ncbi:pentatricopeptide repeat-containing protein At2g22070-like [Selaginella moellendorffii]|uniref:pentatricopeptide repeat-containing protein At2g22070-like n=1 Tax=Selaginella moellendorffii TaxID=88036 RepID=UPI000D1C5EB0|nr:pentatricopeptide repeat-containing protein At2g22070-like [Selaginella moellendorffii]|eukprot:XP_024544758.1 pentatricopeptide repeat-containing protein At2g22070-like [Selaginella moellendorffii]